MTQSKYLSFLFAGLVAAAGVHAQSTPAAGSSDSPPKAGEASTVTQGKPNIDPNAAPRALTRQEVVAELMQRRSTFEANRRAMRNPDARMGVMGGTTTQ